MKQSQISRDLWGVLWRSKNRLSGLTEHLIHDEPRVPALFATRAEAQAWIEDKYGYIRGRPDLRAEPHGWRLPVALKVRVDRLAQPIT